MFLFSLNFKSLLLIIGASFFSFNTLSDQKIACSKSSFWYPSSYQWFEITPKDPTTQTFRMLYGVGIKEQMLEIKLELTLSQTLNQPNHQVYESKIDSHTQFHLQIRSGILNASLTQNGKEKWRKKRFICFN